jgi:putative glycosyltransferase (TIGR04372 family)
LNGTAAAKPEPNALCGCGSGRTYKTCCRLSAGTAAVPEPRPAAALTVAIDPAPARSLRVQIQAPDNPLALHQMGLAAFHRKDYPAAVEAFRAALAACGWHPDYHRELARVLAATGQFEEAVGFYLAAVSLKRDFAEAAAELGALLEGRRIREVRLTILHYPRIGELGLAPDLALRRRQIDGAPSDRLHLFVSGEKPANRQLLEMLKREIHLVESDALLAGLHRWIPNLSGLERLVEVNYAEDRFSVLEVGGARIVNHPPHRESNEFGLYQATEGSLRFTPEEEARGQDGLRTMGLDPKRDWFVCLFARDRVYLDRLLPGYRFDDTRNADIDSYGPAARRIVAAGGHVIRMGHGVAKPFGTRHPRVIDYASRGRDDFMDVYLMAHCRFVLGTTSGICDVAMLFDVPRVGTNWLPLGSAPWGKTCLFIPKLLRDARSGERPPFRRFLEDSRSFESPLLWSHANSERFVCEDNRPEDILAATDEMLARLDGRFEDSEADRALQARYFARFPADHWSAEVRTPMGRDFLRRHRAYFLES